MDFRGASADAVAALDEWAASADKKSAGFARTGAELLELAGVVRGEPALRRMVTDPSVAVQAKQALIGHLFDGKVSATTLGLLREAVARRWTSSADFANAIERLGERATVRSAGKESGRIVDELFEFDQSVSGNPQLRDALADPGRSVDDRAGLVRSLLDGKAHPATVALAQHALRGSHRTVASALASYRETASDVRGESVATVRVARPLTGDHATRLAKALSEKYGRKVHLNVQVDPSVVGGISVAIGDDVIDGTVAARLEDARRRLAG